MALREADYRMVGAGSDARAAWEAFAALARAAPDEPFVDAFGTTCRLEADDGDTLLYDAGRELTFRRLFTFTDADGEYRL